MDLPLVTPSLARASRERLERFGIRPNRELGQNFLIDDNILEVIGRTAALSAGDVVLEVGGGLGILSEYLAEQVAHVHVVEADHALEPVLADAVGGRSNVTLVFDDVIDADLRRLDPPPLKVVANLPYGVAVPATVRTIDQLPGVDLWCLLVQREIADRLAAKPNTKAYGIPSVIVQLSCAVEFVRPISRTVFQPVPNVDSALIRLRRTGAAPPGSVRRLVRASFAHRRKALARSLQLALGAEEARAAARTALERIEHPADARAEQLAPEEFVELAASLERFLPVDG